MDEPEDGKRRSAFKYGKLPDAIFTTAPGGGEYGGGALPRDI